MSDQLSGMFAALADPTRRDIVARLATGDAAINELAERYSMTVQAVSKHVKVLTEAGLVSRSVAARRRPCHLAPAAFDLMAQWIEQYHRQAQQRYERLDTVLEQLDTPTPNQQDERGGTPS